MSHQPSPQRKPNVVLFGIDSLLSKHMICYSYERPTTPHIDRFATRGTLFENTFSPHIPTGAYSSMLSGRDCFGTAAKLQAKSRS